MPRAKSAGWKRDWLKRASDNGRKPVKQIVFTGERFDVMSVRRWRERVWGGGGSGCGAGCSSRDLG